MVLNIVTKVVHEHLHFHLRQSNYLNCAPKFLQNVSFQFSSDDLLGDINLRISISDAGYIIDTYSPNVSHHYPSCQKCQHMVPLV